MIHTDRRNVSIKGDTHKYVMLCAACDAVIT